MYRVMLIDDEPAVRKLLRASVNWEDLNMEVVGEAASGIEAINVIDDMKPDIAFVDISMPFMNGIEFTEMATKTYPNLIIIILTAMDEFEYARKCVRLPVFEYMLKPIVRKEINDTLTAAKKLLDEKTPDVCTDEKEENEDASCFNRVQKYVEEHFADPQINLTTVSMQFGFNQCYLSRKFKQGTGKSFIEFLTECRMNKAMELAKQNKKMFYTSTEVGIPDPNYFGRCFKKYAGKSYSEYVAENANN